MLDELDRYFEEFEKDVQDAVRDSISADQAVHQALRGRILVQLGPEGKPSVQFFGDNPQHHDGYRSPMSEQILDEKNGLLRLVLDMPGVEKGDIRVAATEDSAVVTAERDSGSTGLTSA